MPNILIGYKGKFEPFSFEELLKPIAYATEQQNAYEEAYDTLGDAADAVGASLDPNDPGNKDALALYNNYNIKLNAARDQLLEKGFKDPNTRQNLMDAKKAYTNDMQRVAKAVNERQGVQKWMSEQKNKNPRTVFSPIGTIDDYLHGTAPNVVSLDLKDIDSRSEKLGEAAASRFYRDGIEPLGNGMFRVRTKQGYDRIETLEAILKTPRTDENNNIIYKSDGKTPQLAYPEIAFMYNQLYSDPNVQQYLAAMPDEDSFNYATGMIDSSIREGLLKGMTLKESVSYHNIPKSSGGSGGSGTGRGKKDKDDEEDNGEGFDVSVTSMQIGNEDAKDREKTGNDWRITYSSGLAGPQNKYSLIGRKTKGIRSRKEYIKYSIQDEWGDKVDFDLYDKNGNFSKEAINYVKTHDPRIDPNFSNERRNSMAKSYLKTFVNSRNKEYDDFYNVYHNELGMNPGDSWKNFDSRLKEYERKGKGLHAKGIEMKAWEDDANFLENIMQLGEVYEVTNTNPEKVITLDKKPADFTNMKNPLTGQSNIGKYRIFINPALKDADGNTYVFVAIGKRLFAFDPALINDNVDTLLRGYSGLFGDNVTDSDVEDFFNNVKDDELLQYDKLNSSSKRIIKNAMNNVYIPGLRRSAYETISDAYFLQDTRKVTDSKKASRTQIP